MATVTLTATSHIHKVTLAHMQPHPQCQWYSHSPESRSYICTQNSSQTPKPHTQIIVIPQPHSQPHFPTLPSPPIYTRNLTCRHTPITILITLPTTVPPHTITPLPPPYPSSVTHIPIVTPAHIVTLYPCYISKSCTQHQPYTIPQVIY